MAAKMLKAANALKEVLERVVKAPSTSAAKMRDGNKQVSANG
jgi:hypothetical protein